MDLNQKPFNVEHIRGLFFVRLYNRYVVNRQYNNGAFRNVYAGKKARRCGKNDKMAGDIKCKTIF